MPVYLSSLSFSSLLSSFISFLFYIVLIVMVIFNSLFFPLPNSVSHFLLASVFCALTLTISSHTLSFLLHLFSLLHSSHQICFSFHPCRLGPARIPLFSTREISRILRVTSWNCAHRLIKERSGPLFLQISLFSLASLTIVPIYCVLLNYEIYCSQLLQHVHIKKHSHMLTDQAV